MKLTHIITTLSLLVLTAGAFAGTPLGSGAGVSEDTGRSEELNLRHSPEEYDSLLSMWYERNVVSSQEEFFRDFVDIDTSIVPKSDIPDSVYMARLKGILSPIQLPYNDVIKRYMHAYTGYNKGTISRILGLAQVYFPMIEEELARENMPLELRMLPVIESALNPSAISRAGATGLWQFMYTTGRHYGLEITSFVDQRCDPVASTKAACRYLRDLYKIYSDWTLALAAYNCGPGNVNKAIKRAGDNAKTYWDIYEHLPHETRGYVPAFVGATYAYTYHRLHGIEPTEPPTPISTDTLQVNKLMHLGQVASTLDIPIETLKALNPQYKMDIIPAQDRTYFLTIPQYDVARYIENEKEILAKDTVYLAQYLAKDPVTLKQEFNITYVAYSVKQGDTLGAIARRHGTTVSKIMKANNIRNPNALRIGQRLEIYR